MTTQETETIIEKKDSETSGGKEIPLLEKNDELKIKIKMGTTNSPAMKAARASGARGISNSKHR